MLKPIPDNIYYRYNND